MQRFKTRRSVHLRKIINQVVQKSEHNHKRALAVLAVVVVLFGILFPVNMVFAADNVASINGTGYDTLQSAVDAASTGDTITLLTDITYSSSASSLTTAKSITIDGNGHSITPSTSGWRDGCAVSVQSGGTITLTNIVIDGSNLSGSQLINIGSGSTVNLNSGTVIRNFSGGNVSNGQSAVRNYGNLNVNGATFSNNTTRWWGTAIYSQGGNVSISNATFSNNTVTGGSGNSPWGGAIMAYGGSVTISGSTFSNNRASNSTYETVGGAVALFSCSSASISGCTFSGNSAQDGGAIAVVGTPTTITSTTITGNSATVGGGMFIQGSSVNASSGNTIAGNTASDAAADVYVTNGSVSLPSANSMGYAGWYEDDSPRYSAASSPTEVTDLTVTVGSSEDKSLIAAGTYTPSGAYILTYNANGGTGAPAAQGNDTGVFTISSTIPTRTDYTFLGWATSSDADTSEYSAGGTITVVNSSTTLYAVWISDADAEKKQGVPSVEKKAWDATSASDSWQDTAFAAVNGISSDKNITFKITGTMPDNLNAKATDDEGNETGEDVYSSYTDYKFTDQYQSGIQINTDSIKVYLYGSDGLTTQTPGSDAVDITELFDIETSDGEFTVNLKKSGVAATDGTTGAVDLKKSYTIGGNTVSFTASSKIVIYYTATLSSSATVGADGNYNQARLEFRNAKGEYLYTPYDKVKVFTFQLQVIKYKDSVAVGNQLSGASFKLYKGSKDSGNVVASGTSASGTGIVAFDNLTTITPGTYILEETNAPLDGYNTMPDMTIVITATTNTPNASPALTNLSVTATGGDGGEWSVEDNKVITGKVINKAGNLLPSTGGVGTIIFTLIGLVMIIGAGVLLWKRRRV